MNEKSDICNSLPVRLGGSIYYYVSEFIITIYLSTQKTPLCATFMHVRTQEGTLLSFTTKFVVLINRLVHAWKCRCAKHQEILRQCGRFYTSWNQAPILSVAFSMADLRLPTCRVGKPYLWAECNQRCLTFETADYHASMSEKYLVHLLSIVLQWSIMGMSEARNSRSRHHRTNLAPAHEQPATSRFVYSSLYILACLEPYSIILSKGNVSSCRVHENFACRIFVVWKSIDGNFVRWFKFRINCRSRSVLTPPNFSPSLIVRFLSVGNDLCFGTTGMFLNAIKLLVQLLSLRLVPNIW